jgi:hypothetical protein
MAQRWAQLVCKGAAPDGLRGFGLGVGGGGAGLEDEGGYDSVDGRAVVGAGCA